LFADSGRTQWKQFTIYKIIFFTRAPLETSFSLGLMRLILPRVNKIPMKVTKGDIFNIFKFVVTHLVIFQNIQLYS
jgi:hypothetical protein